MIDSRLPIRTPPLYKKPTKILPFALYLHIKLDEKDKQELIRDCNSNYRPHVVILADKSFVGQALDQSLYHHLWQTALFDGRFYLALIDDNWRTNGVSVVTLDAGFNRPDQLKAPTDLVDLWLVELQEVTYNGSQFAFYHYEDWMTRRKRLRIRYMESENITQTDASKSKLGQWIPLYTSESDPEEVIRRLDHHYPSSVLRWEGHVVDQKHALRLHELRWQEDKNVCRTLMVYAKIREFSEKGVTVLHQRSYDDEPYRRRLPVNGWNVASLLCQVVHYDIELCAFSPKFIFYTPCGKESTDSIIFLDPKANRRCWNNDRFVQRLLPADSLLPKLSNGNTWQDLIDWQKQQCSVEYFHHDLEKRHFAYAEEAVERSDQLILIFEIDPSWHQIRCKRCAAKDAFEELHKWSRLEFNITWNQWLRQNHKLDN